MAAAGLRARSRRAGDCFAGGAPQELTVFNHVDVLLHVATRRSARAWSRRGPERSDAGNWQRAEQDVHREFEESIRRVRAS